MSSNVWLSDVGIGRDVGCGEGRMTKPAVAGSGIACHEEKVVCRSLKAGCRNLVTTIWADS